MELSRRQLVLAALRAGLGASAAALVACRTPRDTAFTPTPPGVPLRRFTAPQAAVLAAVLDTLLPPGGGFPGARDVHALGYLDGILSAPRAPAGDHAALVDGVAALEARVRTSPGGSFAGLAPGERDRVLRAHERDEDGRAFLGTLLVYALEALLADPLYGGNTAEAGWTWLGHLPGQPRPVKPYWET